MTVRRISISEFKVHCTEELRKIEKGDLILEVTRRGKVIAVVQPVVASTPTLAEWIGSGAGLMSPAASSQFDEPAF